MLRKKIKRTELFFILYNMVYYNKLLERKKMRFYNILLIFFLFGCSNITPPEEFMYKEIDTPYFTIASWQKERIPNNSFRIYIEGDGNSFNSFGLPSSDPTPKGTLLRRIAFSDNSPNVIYLARPCQFIKDPLCKQEYWSISRFAPEVIVSYCSALEKLSGGKPTTLIGYSGGGMIAGLISVKCSDLNIVKVVTVAGNLDHKAWTQFHGDTPLINSLNLADYQDKFSKVPQHHFIAQEDQVIPLNLAIKAIREPNNITIIKGADHSSGWEKAFSSIHKE